MADDLDYDKNGNKISLPFAENMQLAILGHLLTNNEWFLQCKGLLRPNWFINPTVGKIYGIKLARAAKQDMPQTFDQMESANEIISEDAKEKAKMMALIKSAKYLADENHFPLSSVAQEMTDWMHSIMFQSSINKAVDHFNRKEPNKAYDIVRVTMEDIRLKSFNEDKSERFDNFGGDMQKDEEEYKNALTFGLSIFDQLLAKKGAGGLLRGDTSVVLAPLNVGKTSSMITTACANIKRGKDVLLVTHEGTAASIKQKIRCCMMEMSDVDLINGWKNRKDKDAYTMKMSQIHNMLNEHLVYMPMNHAGLTVEEVASAVRRKQEERKIVKNGKGFDLFVNDYPACLTSSTLAGHNQKRQIDDFIYKYFVQLALEFNWHSLLAIQTNREGAKNNKWYAERLLTTEDVSESFGPMQSATNVWTINRDPMAKAANRLTYYLDKSRSSETGIAVVCKTNFAASISHSDKMGAIWYRGTDSYTNIVDSVLASTPVIDPDDQINIDKYNVEQVLFKAVADKDKV